MATRDPTAVNTAKNFQRLQYRHWRYGSVEAFNRFREFLYARETKITDQKIEKFVNRIKKLPDKERKPNILHYSLPVDNA